MNIFKELRHKRAENVLKIVEKAHLFKRYFFLVLGCLLFASAYNLFLFKNKIVFGGVSGLSIITKEYIDPSLFILFANVFLLILSHFLLGKKKTFNSLVGSLIFPLFIKLTQNISSVISISNDDLLLISIFGGVIIGIAYGIVFKSGFTTGGTDILNQIFSKYFNLSLGTSMLITDGFIVILGGFFFGWTRVLYAMIVLYIINIMVDKVVLGISSSKAIYITTSEDALVCDYILNELNLGATLIETRGGFTNKKDQIIMCVVSTSDYFKVSQGLAQIDPNAVILVTDAYQTSKIYSGKGSEENGIHKI